MIQLNNLYMAAFASRIACAIGLQAETLEVDELQAINHELMAIVKHAFSGEKRYAGFQSEVVSLRFAKNEEGQIILETTDRNDADDKATLLTQDAFEWFFKDNYAESLKYLEELSEVNLMLSVMTVATLSRERSSSLLLTTTPIRSLKTSSPTAMLLWRFKSVRKFCFDRAATIKFCSMGTNCSCGTPLVISWFGSPKKSLHVSSSGSAFS